jgi:hypothetical protein
VLAFESGVDDFLAKPFYPPELGARVSAVLRGFVARGDAPSPCVPAGSAIQLDPRTGRVIADGRPVELTPRERELLSALIAQAGRVSAARSSRPAPGGSRAAQRTRNRCAHQEHPAQARPVARLHRDRARRSVSPLRRCVHRKRNAVALSSPQGF